jgi:maltooligosyltrehalose trehalohydrolase
MFTHNDETAIGAHYLGQGRCFFRVWAPDVACVEVHRITEPECAIPLDRTPDGYHAARVRDIWPGYLYRYRLDGRVERPDPASRFQPQGVHGPSLVVDPTYDWKDISWKGIDLKDYVIYEVHVGTYTAQGNFAAIIPRLSDLIDLGITAIELMPVAQFPGERNWGYDGAYPFAVQKSYGGPQGLKDLVNACHGHGLAVILDVVYNHLGPEGNYLADFGPYFTDRYQTPWGKAVNFDGEQSDEVRNYFIANARHWIRDFHIDALRLDAVHAIMDLSPAPFLSQLAGEVKDEAACLGRRVHLFVESNLNDARLVRAPESGGMGLDALWSDDFHHSLHTLVTNESSGYYQDYGRIEHLAKALGEGFTYTGEYSAFRRRRHGNSAADIPGASFVVFSQNHDQIGNRCQGNRLSTLVSFETLKLLAGMVILSPYLPLFFMGEEYGEKAPFPYFISHGDPDLVQAVRAGRIAEFAAFHHGAIPPDPQDEATYLSARLDYATNTQGRHVLRRFYRTLLKLRREVPALSCLDKHSLTIESLEEIGILVFRRRAPSSEILAVFHFDPATSSTTIFPETGRWVKLVDSADVSWMGPGSVIPERIECRGATVSLDIPGMAFVIFGKDY